MSWYRTGTVNLTNGSKTVTGVGTDFIGSVASPNIVSGFAFLGPDAKIYEVDQVISSTSLTLITNYGGTTASAQAYGIFQTQGIIASLSAQVATLLTTFGPLRDAVPTIIGYMNAASASAAAALASQNAAATSATNAANSATAASTSATNAANSATAASGSATAAATSATNAATSATAATTNGAAQVALATTQANNAAASATQAATTVQGLGFGQNVATTTGLTYGYLAGIVRQDNNIVRVANGTITLLPTALWFLSVQANGTVVANLTNYAPNTAPIAQVTVNATNVTNVVDSRTLTHIAPLAAQVSSINGGQLAGLRNLVINGDMRIAQRASTYALTTGFAYGSIDRWCVISTSAAGRFNQNGLPSAPGFQFYAVLGRTSGQTATGILAMNHAIETLNSVPLQGKQVTLSFWAKAGANFSAASNALSYSVWQGAGGDQGAGSMPGWSSASQIITGFQNLTTTWTRYQFTGTVSSAATQLGINLQYTPTGTAGTSDEVYITGVQLEVGSQATPYEQIPYGLQLKLCQRYYSTFDSAAGGAYPSANGANASCSVPFPETMRVAPTVALGVVGSPSNLDSDTLGQQSQRGCVYTVIQGTGAGNFRGNRFLNTANAEL